MSAFDKFVLAAKRRDTAVGRLVYDTYKRLMRFDIPDNEITRIMYGSLYVGHHMAVDAREWGLVNEVVAHEELLPYCRKLAADIVSNDQMGVRRMLQTYNEVTGTTIDEGWKIEARVSRDWEGPGFDPASIEARRMKVVERGRQQIQS